MDIKYWMLMCTQPIALFLQMADVLYGPITMICQNSHIVKKIPWSAFIFTDRDWEWMKNARDILKVCHFICTSQLSDSPMLLCRIQMTFSNILFGMASDTLVHTSHTRRITNSMGRKEGLWWIHIVWGCYWWLPEQVMEILFSHGQQASIHSCTWSVS